MFIDRNRDRGRKNGGTHSRLTTSNTNRRVSSQPSRVPNQQAGMRQGQQQQQRPPAFHHQQQAKQSTQHSSMQLQPMHDITINMDDIMSDLMHLESQQKESKRKLENAKTRKQLAMETHHNTNQKLETLKYENGIRTKQIEEAQQKLKIAVRVNGEWKLQTERNRDATKAFGEDLEDGLKNARRNNEIRRKIEQLLAYTLSRGTTLKGKIKYSMTKPRQMETQRDRVLQKLESLRQNVRDETAQAQQCMVQVMNARAESEKLQGEKAKAQQTERATQSQAESRQNELESSTKQHERAMESMEKQIQECHNAKKSSKNVEAELTSTIAKIKQETTDLQTKLLGVLKNEAGFEEGSDPMDLVWLESSLRTQEQALQEDKDGQQLASDSVQLLTKENSDLQKQIQSYQTAIDEATEETREENHRQTERRNKLQNHLDDRDAIQSELESMKSNHLQLLENGKKQQDEAVERMTALKDLISKEEQAIDGLQSQIESLTSSINASQDSWMKTKGEILDTKDELQRLNSKAETRFEELSERLSEAQTSKLKPLPSNETKQDEMVKLGQAMTKIATLQEKHLELVGIPRIYDPDTTVKEQAKVCMKDLVLSCTQNIQSAQKRFEEQEISEIERKVALLKQERIRQEAETKRRLAERKALEKEKRLKEEAEAKRLQAIEEEARQKAEEEERIRLEHEMARQKAEKELARQQLEEEKQRERQEEEQRVKDEEARKAREVEEQQERERHLAEEKSRKELEAKKKAVDKKRQVEERKLQKEQRLKDQEKKPQLEGEELKKKTHDSAPAKKGHYGDRNKGQKKTRDSYKSSDSAEKLPISRNSKGKLSMSGPTTNSEDILYDNESDLESVGSNGNTVTSRAPKDPPFTPMTPRRSSLKVKDARSVQSQHSVSKRVRWNHDYDEEEISDPESARGESTRKARKRIKYGSGTSSDARDLSSNSSRGDHSSDRRKSAPVSKSRRSSKSKGRRGSSVGDDEGGVLGMASSESKANSRRLEATSGSKYSSSKEESKGLSTSETVTEKEQPKARVKRRIDLNALSQSRSSRHDVKKARSSTGSSKNRRHSSDKHSSRSSGKAHSSSDKNTSRSSSSNKVKAPSGNDSVSIRRRRKKVPNKSSKKKASALLPDFDFKF